MADRSARGGSQREQDKDKKRLSRYRILAEYLSSDERSALKDLSHYLTRHRVPPSQRLRLVSLGLATISDGAVVLTAEGRRVLAALLGLLKRQ